LTLRVSLAQVLDRAAIAEFRRRKTRAQVRFAKGGP
jgi:hypothetical protein